MNSRQESKASSCQLNSIPLRTKSKRRTHCRKTATNGKRESIRKTSKWRLKLKQWTFRKKNFLSRSRLYLAKKKRSKKVSITNQWKTKRYLSVARCTSCKYLSLSSKSNQFWICSQDSKMRSPVILSVKCSLRLLKLLSRAICLTRSLLRRRTSSCLKRANYESMPNEKSRDFYRPRSSISERKLSKVELAWESCTRVEKNLKIDSMS